MVNRHFLQADSTLAVLPALLRTAASDRPIDQQIANNVLRDLNFQSLTFRDVLLVQRDGQVWASSLPTSRRSGLPVDFETLAASPRAGVLRIAGPIRSPATSEWSIFLLRPVSLNEVGSLLAVVELPLQMVTGLLAIPGDAQRMRIRLERDDGQLLASVPHDEASIGRAFPRPAEFNSDGAAFEAVDPTTGSSTIEVVRRTLYRDILVHVSTELPDALAEWSRDRTRLTAVTAIAAVLLLALLIAMNVSLTQRERMDAERAKAREVLENAIEAMPDGFVMWDTEDRLVTCNRRFREIYSESAELLVPGVRFNDVLRGGVHRGQYPQCGPDVEAFIEEIASWRRHGEQPLERLLPNGRWLLVSEQRTPDGGHVGIRTDITALKQAMVHLSQANAFADAAARDAQVQSTRLEAALGNMSQGLCMVGSDGRLIVCNKRLIEIFQLDAQSAAPGTPLNDLFAAIRAAEPAGAGLVVSIYSKQLALAEARDGADFLVETATRSLAISHRPMPDGGWVATYEDATERRHAEARLRHMAHHDALTGLPNRILFHSRLAEMLRITDNRRDEVALLCLDLDRFKLVNDTMGHPAGDALLIAASSRLRGCVRETDLVVRLGGDEFAVVHRGSRQAASAEILARRIIEALSAPYEIAGSRVVVGATIGIAHAGIAKIDADALLKCADVALYRAKSKGRGTFCHYEERMSFGLRERLDLEAELRDALSNNQLRIAYQPIYQLASNRISGFEALLRWHHPKLGHISPAEFVPIAEESGLILPIGEWVLRSTCAAAALWPEWVKLAVNLSPVQLRNEALQKLVKDVLGESGLDPHRLELEITETALLQDLQVTHATLQGLRTTGVGIALDDFGTGYSSLRHLANLPVDRIKIDRSFVAGLEERPDCRAIIGSVVGLAAQLEIATTAEGIETAGQLALIKSAGCLEGQGYLLGKPAPLETALSLFESGVEASAA